MGPFLASAAALILMACFDKGSPVKALDPVIPIAFDASTDGLPMADTTPEIRLADGDTLTLRVTWVAKEINGRKVRMLAYNGSIPGPRIRVPQGASITLTLANGTGLPTSLHSHGVRLAAVDDGVPGMGADALDSGETQVYRLRFPDPGLFWYHPHAREDYAMELGLYGNYVVEPSDSTYWPKAHREVPLVLDDILLEGDRVMPYYSNHVDHALMGRFGNAFLVNGDTAYTLKVKRNELIRFAVTNASGARVYKLRFSRDTDLNILGADNGRFEFPYTQETELVAPSERLIFQAWLHDPQEEWDTLDLWHITPQKNFVIARFVFEEEEAQPDLSGSIDLIRSPIAGASMDSVRSQFGRPPDQELLLTGTMDMSRLGMPKEAHKEPGNEAGIEWLDHMGAMNSGSNLRNTAWILRDRRTGKENHAIDWSFKKGDKVLIRITNDSTAVHPMPHPIHFHGQRFLVLRENGKPRLDRLAWKDSYLIGTGYTVDILLDASNPGKWMFHCHIPEHLQSDMMGHFTVAE
jgi:FtsP/CotA-like multicopper oxidase with cupredoxin domain